MDHDLRLSAAQIIALQVWTDAEGADVLIAQCLPVGSIYVGQGDSRCVISIAGFIEEEES